MTNNNQFKSLGYFPERAHWFDNLYLILLEHKETRLIKVGRTFDDLDTRFENQDVKIVSVFDIWKATHREIYFVEQSVLEAFKEYKYKGEYIEEMNSSECFELTLPLDQVIQFIKDKFFGCWRQHGAK